MLEWPFRIVQNRDEDWSVVEGSLGRGCHLSKAVSSARMLSKESQELRPSSASMFRSCFGDGWMD